MSALPTFDDIMRIIGARRRLQRMVDERAASFEVRDYAKRREAALKGRRLVT